MKKLIIIFTILFIGLPIFAQEDYYLGKKYKKEVTKIINKEYKKSIKSIDKVVLLCEKESDYDKQKMLKQDAISDIVFEVYKKLAYKTNDYTRLTPEQLNTGWKLDLIYFVLPYLENNNVNTIKLNKLSKYASEKQIELNKKCAIKTNY